MKSVVHAFRTGEYNHMRSGRYSYSNGSLITPNVGSASNMGVRASRSNKTVLQVYKALEKSTSPDDVSSIERSTLCLAYESQEVDFKQPSGTTEQRPCHDVRPLLFAFETDWR